MYTQKKIQFRVRMGESHFSKKTFNSTLSSFIILRQVKLIDDLKNAWDHLLWSFHF